MATVKVPHLVKCRQCWVARIKVPPYAQKALGKRHLSWSTGERDLARAAMKARPILAEWQARIEAAKRGGRSPLQARVADIRAEYRVMMRDNPPEAMEWLAETMEALLRHRGADFSEAEYEAAMNKNGYDRGRTLSTLDPELGEALDTIMEATTPFLEFEETWAAQLATRTDKQKDEYRRDVKAFGAGRTLEGLKARDVQAWIDERIAAGEKVATVRRRMSALRNYWGWMRDREHVPAGSGPLGAPKYPRRDRQAATGEKPRDSFTGKDVATLHAAALAGGDKPLADLIALAAYTGARIEELCSLEVSSVVVAASDGKPAITISGAKTDAGERTIPVHDDAAALVTRLVADAQAGKWLIHTASDNKYDKRSPAMSKRFGRLKKAQGFGRDLVFHSVRKMVATMLHDAECPEPIAADILGHKLTTMTYGVYSSGSTLKVRRGWLQSALSYQFDAAPRVTNP